MSGGQPLAGVLPPALAETLAAGLLCNDSRLVEKDSRWQVEGDPTEGALIASAGKGRARGLPSPGAIGACWKRLEPASPGCRAVRCALPVHGYPARCRRRPSHALIYLKGSVEAVLPRCTSTLDASGRAIGLDEAAVHAAVDDMATQGLRVPGFARGELPAGRGARDPRGHGGRLGLPGPAGHDRPAASRGDSRRAGVPGSRHQRQDDHRRSRQDRRRHRLPDRPQGQLRRPPMARRRTC